MNISRDFFGPIWAQFGEEVRERLPEFEEKHREILHTPPETLPTVRRHDTGAIAGSVDLADGIYLYLLVRALKPKILFEIGTWTGMSAMFMAEAIKANGSGHIYTCDIHDHYVLSNTYDSYVTRVHAMSDCALVQIPQELKFDFVFTDGDITPTTTESLQSRIHDETIIATHDFTFPGEKGVSNLVCLQRAHNNKFAYVFPWQPKNRILPLHSCTALLVPLAVLEQKDIPAPSRLQRTMQTFWYAVYTEFGRVYRKLQQLWRV